VTAVFEPNDGGTFASSTSKVATVKVKEAALKNTAKPKLTSGTATTKP
jgi:hypothetical protein